MQIQIVGYSVRKWLRVFKMSFTPCKEKKKIVKRIFCTKRQTKQT